MAKLQKNCLIFNRFISPISEERKKLSALKYVLALKETRAPCYITSHSFVVYGKSVMKEFRHPVNIFYGQV